MSIGALGSTSSVDGVSRIQEMQKLFQKADVNSDNGIDSEEFSKIFSRGSDSVEISAEAQELFDSLDANGDGTLDENEHADGADDIGKMLDANAPSASEMGQMFLGEFPADLDIDGDGVIDEDEFAEMLAKRAEETGEELDADELFAELDKDGNGTLSAEEMRPPEDSPAPPPPPEEEDDLDTNGDGYISDEERAAASGIDFPVSSGFEETEQVM